MNRKSFLVLGLLACTAVCSASAAELRIGMIGLEVLDVLRDRTAPA